jgi:hypothetical protein
MGRSDEAGEKASGNDEGELKTWPATPVIIVSSCSPAFRLEPCRRCFLEKGSSRGRPAIRENFDFRFLILDLSIQGSVVEIPKSAIVKSRIGNALCRAKKQSNPFHFTSMTF